MIGWVVVVVLFAAIGFMSWKTLVAFRQLEALRAERKRREAQR